MINIDYKAGIPFNNELKFGTAGMVMVRKDAMQDEEIMKERQRTDEDDRKDAIEVRGYDNAAETNDDDDEGEPPTRRARHDRHGSARGRSFIRS